MIQKSRLHFVSHLPENLDFQKSILIFDPVLSSKNSRWIKKFPRRLAVRSGEKLKDLRHFPKWMEQVLQLSDGLSKDLTIVAFGGGSVGDFAGFIASILKRGVGFVQIPSTWLSAMDSAHGGKTALNVGNIKNQIGTFYSAQDIFLVKNILLSQPADRISEALGEYYKMALIAGGPLWKGVRPATKMDSQVLWVNLPKVIQAKWKIVQKDPYEKKSLRHILNLGHTVGHVLEAELRIPHGRAVHWGLLFSLNWGERLGIWKYRRTVPAGVLPDENELKRALRKIKNPLVVLRKDKKLDREGKVQFVFVRRPGHVVTKKVQLSELVNEWQRQQK